VLVQLGKDVVSLGDVDDLAAAASLALSCELSFEANFTALGVVRGSAVPVSPPVGLEVADGLAALRESLGEALFQHSVGGDLDLVLGLGLHATSPGPTSTSMDAIDSRVTTFNFATSIH